MTKTLTLLTALTLLTTGTIAQAAAPGDEKRFEKLIAKYAIPFPVGNEKLRPKAACRCSNAKPGFVAIDGPGDILCYLPSFRPDGSLEFVGECTNFEILAR